MTTKENTDREEDMVDAVWDGRGVVNNGRGGEVGGEDW